VIFGPDLMKNERFEGAFNPFVFSRTYALDFQCLFDLHDYPFDTQNCQMLVKKITFTSDEAISLVDCFHEQQTQCCNVQDPFLRL
jgi:hypothetical protein